MSQIWSKQRCAEEAAKYTTRSDFYHGSRGAYRATLAYGWFDETAARWPHHLSQSSATRRSCAARSAAIWRTPVRVSYFRASSAHSSSVKSLPGLRRYSMCEQISSSFSKMISSSVFGKRALRSSTLRKAAALAEQHCSGRSKRVLPRHRSINLDQRFSEDPRVPTFQRKRMDGSRKFVPTLICSERQTELGAKSGAPKRRSDLRRELRSSADALAHTMPR